MDTVPAVGSQKREISPARLDLPEPVAPTSARVPPAGTASVTSVSASRSAAG